jgi:hypothetical protein
MPILGLEVSDHLWIGAVAQPEVIVDTPVAVPRDFLRDDFGGWRLNY